MLELVLFAEPPLPPCAHDEVDDRLSMSILVSTDTPSLPPLLLPPPLLPPPLLPPQSRWH
ncbi:MAG: hypothetical protein DCF16_05370 [Alphaproteobacteria bacterium]|nr:MAG: hypothetical protein DCF16_05370 [Alphaproteobacteria bacterium]